MKQLFLGLLEYPLTYFPQLELCNPDFVILNPCHQNCIILPLFCLKFFDGYIALTIKAKLLNMVYKALNDLAPACLSTKSHSPYSILVSKLHSHWPYLVVLQVPLAISLYLDLSRSFFLCLEVFSFTLDNYCYQLGLDNYYSFFKSLLKGHTFQIST